MAAPTERNIMSIESCVVYEDPAKAVRILAEAGVTGYDAWLAWKAAEVNVRMSQREYVENK